MIPKKMAVIEQKLSKVAHPLYAATVMDATNNCIRDFLGMSRVKAEELVLSPPHTKK